MKKVLVALALVVGFAACSASVGSGSLGPSKGKDIPGDFFVDPPSGPGVTGSDLPFLGEVPVQPRSLPNPDADVPPVTDASDVLDGGTEDPVDAGTEDPVDAGTSDDAGEDLPNGCTETGNGKAVALGHTKHGDKSNNGKGYGCGHAKFHTEEQ